MMTYSRGLLETEKFLDIVWGADAADNSVVELRGSSGKGFGDGRLFRVFGIPSKKNEMLEDISETLAATPHNAHFLPARFSSKKTTNATAVLFGALWADIDNVRPAEIETTLEDLSELGIPPTIVVDSGWGAHLYWVVHSPYTGGKEVGKMNAILAALSGGDAAASPPAHALRLPGSLNCKTNVPRRTSAYLRGDIFDPEILRKKILLCESLLPECSFREKSVEGNTWTAPPDAEGRRKNFDECAAPSWENEKLRSELCSCPILRTALETPDELGYASWMSLAGALHRICGFKNGEEAFLELSKLSEMKFDESTVKNAWRSVVSRDMTAWSCSKTEEGRGCPESIENEGACKGLLSFLSRTLRSAG